MRVRPTRMSTEMFGAGAGSGWWSHLAHTWNRPGIRKPFKALCRVLRLWRKTWLIESVPLSHQWSRLPLRTLDLADKRCLQEGGGTHHRWTLSCYNRLLTRLLRRPHGRIADLPSGCRLALRPCATLQGALEATFGGGEANVFRCYSRMRTGRHFGDFCDKGLFLVKIQRHVYIHLFARVLDRGLTPL